MECLTFRWIGYPSPVRVQASSISGRKLSPPAVLSGVIRAMLATVAAAASLLQQKSFSEYHIAVCVRVVVFAQSFKKFHLFMIMFGSFEVLRQFVAPAPSGVHLILIF